MKNFTFIILCFLGCSHTVIGQVSEFISPANNQIDWSNAGIEGGIPSYTNIVDVTTLGVIGDGARDNSSALQTAIDNASPKTVLFFPLGTYLFNSTVYMADEVVLRGVDSERTILNFDLAGSPGRSIEFSKNTPTMATPIISGHSKGTTTITVQNAIGFSVGRYVEISQDNDPTVMPVKWERGWSARAVGQMVEIIAIDGNSIRLRHPLYHDLSPSLNPMARPVDMLKGAGLEFLRLHRIDRGDAYVTLFKYAANCWIKNIESSFCYRSHVGIALSSKIEVRGSYFHHAHDYGEGGHGYGVNLADKPTDCLIEDNIFYFLRHAFLAKEGAIGNVFAYNYSHTPNGSPNDIAMHGHYGSMNLLEGNIVQRIAAGDYWGPSGPGNTYFRNRVEIGPIKMDDRTHYQNIIANELTKYTISISSDSKNTWRHSNYGLSVRGLLDGSYSGILPNSLFRTSRPHYFGDMPWPALGEPTLTGNTIPAKVRWDADIRTGL